MTAIYKRELRACFNSFIGWLFLAVVLFFTGLYVTANNLAQGSAYLTYALQSSLIIFIVAVPILTMRILAEERKNKTDQMILTAPVSVWKIVLGKYLALETVFAIPCAVLCLYPLLLSRYGTIPYGETYVSLLGFFLYGSAAVAVGVFVSSLTESQVIAAVVSVVFIFIGYVMAGICNLISPTGNLLTKVLKVYDLTTPFIALYDQGAFAHLRVRILSRELRIGGDIHILHPNMIGVALIAVQRFDHIQIHAALRREHIDRYILLQAVHHLIRILRQGIQLFLRHIKFRK